MEQNLGVQCKAFQEVRQACLAGIGNLVTLTAESAENAEKRGYISLSAFSAFSAVRKARTMKLNDLTSAIIGAAIKVHRVLGPGLLESAYRACLAYELEKRGFRVEREQPVP
jgi:hypothetical protein